MRQNVLFDRWITWVYVMALMIGSIWHGLDALQGTRAKPGNHLVQYIYKPSHNADLALETLELQIKNSEKV